MLYPFKLSCHPILYTSKSICSVDDSNITITVSKWKNPYKEIEKIVTSYLNAFPEHTGKEPEFILQQAAHIHEESNSVFATLVPILFLEVALIGSLFGPPLIDLDNVHILV